MSTENIDWSKAPKDAEFARHWGDEPGQSGIDFYKKDGYGRLVYLDGNTWDVALTKPNDPDLIPRPAAPWSGQGLPLIDTTCEWLDPGSDRWIPVKVVFLSYWVIVVRDTNHHPEGSVDLAFDLTGDLPQFRPLRTPEQIAAEEREREIEAMATDIMGEQHISGRVMAERLHSLGYRKVDHAGAQP